MAATCALAADGKRLSETRIAGSNSQTTSYNYDNAGRLNQVTLPNGTRRDYDYDRDSNRSQIQESASGCNGTFSTTANYNYDPSTTPGTDQLTSTTIGGNTTDYAYTSDGQVASQGTTSLTWDAFDGPRALRTGARSAPPGAPGGRDGSGWLRGRSS
jgi:YD repeat-containing protein